MTSSSESVGQKVTVSYDLFTDSTKYKTYSILGSRQSVCHTSILLGSNRASDSKLVVVHRVMGSRIGVSKESVRKVMGSKAKWHRAMDSKRLHSTDCHSGLGTDTTSFYLFY